MGFRIHPWRETGRDRQEVRNSRLMSLKAKGRVYISPALTGIDERNRVIILSENYDRMPRRKKHIFSRHEHARKTTRAFAGSCLQLPRHAASHSCQSFSIPLQPMTNHSIMDKQKGLIHGAFIAEILHVVNSLHLIQRWQTIFVWIEISCNK